MEDAPPPAKRRRTEAEADAPLVRSTEYWFDDGNIIVQVESTQFRLTRSLLSMHSSVFRDMFTMPLPADEPTIEGCPVVVLSGDTVSDWIHLLGALYPKCFSDEAPAAETLAGILRLSKKYDIPRFRKDCLRRLKHEFPTTLAEFDALDAASPALIKQESGMLLPLAAVARDIGLFSILPAIYYEIVVTEASTYMPQMLDAQDPRFRVADRLACLQGHIKLLHLQSRTTMSWLDGGYAYVPARSCHSPPICLALVKNIVYHNSMISPPIFALDQWHTSWESGLCGPCLRKAKKYFADGRAACWDKLPSAFGLPEWEELLKSSDFE
ncbi:hypothetical protein C8R46DRAFT_890947 [Mycena filopes]|nr:hypothetical protein C8R46DRAFT_890947 [Mycena filopes]